MIITLAFLLHICILYYNLHIATRYRIELEPREEGKGEGKEFGEGITDNRGSRSIGLYTHLSYILLLQSLKTVRYINNTESTILVFYIGPAKRQKFGLCRHRV